MVWVSLKIRMDDISLGNDDNYIDDINLLHNNRRVMQIKVFSDQSRYCLVQFLCGTQLDAIFELPPYFYRIFGCQQEKKEHK